MKKIIILLFTIFFVISCETSYKYGGYSFTILSDGTVRFDGVHEKLKETISGAFYLPKKIYGRKVTQIGEKAFKNCKKITGITILSTITEIGEDAFEGCTNLKSVTFESPYGWKLEEEGIWIVNTTGLTFTEPKKNAEYLKDTYCNARWYK